MTEEQRTVFDIPEDNLPKFEEQIAKLSRRAKKACGEEISHLVFGYEMRKDAASGKLMKVYQVLIPMSVPKIGQWEFVARLDHSNDTGNIIRTVPNAAPLPEKFRTCAPICEHCGVNRYRRDTFVLRCEETGAYKQIGSGCLIAFLGFDPGRIAKMAEYLGYAMEIGRAGEQFIGGDYRWVEMERFLTHAAWAVRRFGWISASAAREREDLTSTRETALRNAYPPLGRFRETLITVEKPTEEDALLAQEALEWARSLSSKPNLSDYESNVLVIANADVIESRSTGIAASIVGVYYKKKLKEAGLEEIRKSLKNSKHVGNLNERLDIGKVKVISRAAFEGDFGYTYLYRFANEDGNVFVWFASSDQRIQENQDVVLRGTVKKHQIRNDIKETVLTRCKVA